MDRLKVYDLCKVTGPECKVKKKEITDRLRGYPASVRIIKAQLAFESFTVIENKKGFRGN